jgi:hypothetical protein
VECPPRWHEALDQPKYHSLLRKGSFAEIGTTAVKIESRTHLLFSFEKMAIRDAVRSPEGARLFATGLYEFLHGAETPELKFERWCGVIEALPRKRWRVLTWPLVTVFGLSDGRTSTSF